MSEKYCSNCKALKKVTAYERDVWKQTETFHLECGHVVTVYKSRWTL